ncbi:MAG: hypothetical protein QXO78_00780 [Desulfurococcaceae archaeon]|uniref:CDC48 N-terminal subdomain domain-containing protein n=1 Tax=Staphylothermus marinus TaxID=2280 RepID=A0A7C4JNQ2_STAMA
MSSDEVKKETITRKTDISKLVSIVPPASELFKKEKVITEKRIRVKYDSSLSEDQIKIHRDIANTLNIKQGDNVELVVAGKKKLLFKAVIADNIEQNVVFCNPNILVKNGVADNSIVTVRKQIID